jgi:Tfp pilus assembly protein PilF
MGRLCLAGKEFRAARDAFRDALKRDEDHTPTLLALAKLHIQEMEQEDAGKVLRRLMARQGLGEEERIATLTLLMEMGEHAQCVEFIQSEGAAASWKHSAPMLKLLVLGLWKLGKTKEAIQELETLLGVEGETPDTLTMLGRMLVQSGAATLAESRYQKALALDPASQGAAYELARIQLSRGEGGKAVKILENLLALAPDDPDCLYNLACCHARNRNFDDSLHYLKQAMEKGFRDLDKINADEDLTYIRQFKEYNQLAGQSGLI